MAGRMTWLAALVFGCLTVSPAARAVIINQGDSAQLVFNATTATPPFDFVTFSLMFSSANPFGPNETLSYTTFDANNAPLTSAVFASGSSVYTSGLGGQLTQNAIVPFNPATLLNTSSFSVVVTAVSGSFDLIGATASFQHVIFTSGPSELGVPGVFAVAAPEPSALAVTVSGLIVLTLIVRRSNSGVRRNI